MIVEADVSGLEVAAAAFLSKCPVLTGELQRGVNVHEENRKKFNLPSRLVAKKFQFRLLYGGTKFSYAADPEFNWISKDKDFWQEVIDEYYRKYYGLAKWHRDIFYEAMANGKLTMPTGRFFTFKPYLRNGEWIWPRTTILNYPVQGTGHDIVAIARWNSYKRLRNKCLFIMTVHDSIVLDIDNNANLCYNVYRKLKQAVKETPDAFLTRFGVVFPIPLDADVKIGHNWKNMKKLEAENEEEIYDQINYFCSQRGTRS